jgi:type II secretory pathway pseudopilin PulG
MRVSGWNFNAGHSSQATQAHSNCAAIRLRHAISMLELIVSIAIIALLVAILLPVIRKARQRALALQCMDNQRKIIVVVTSFASDNSGEYPESVATIGLMNENWNWQEPTMLTAYRALSPERHRSLSAYLYPYLEDASILSCPAAPQKYKFLQQVWDAGDDWDNPETIWPQDPAIGTYCFFWNYIGCIAEHAGAFKGPQTISCGLARNKLLVSDYFGFGHWRNKLAYGDYRAYGSCERFSRGASVTPGTSVSSAFWSRHTGNVDTALNPLDIELHAAYSDGHVERYSPVDVITMKVSQTPDGSVPYPDDLGPGDFYLPKNALP